MVKIWTVSEMRASRLAAMFDVDAIRTAAAAGDYDSVARLTCGQATQLWAAAMTAHYGPPSLHPDCLDPLGRPTAGARAELPTLEWVMADAAARVTSLVGWYDRHGWELARE